MNANLTNAYVKATDFNSKRDGRLTKRAIIRRRWYRAITGQIPATTNLKYLARAVNLSPAECAHYVRWMSENDGITGKIVGANVVFTF